MRLSTIFQHMIDLEDEMVTRRFRIVSEGVWDYMRYWVFKNVQNHAFGIAVDTKKQDSGRNPMYRNAFLDFARNPLLMEQSPKVMFYAHPRRSINTNGRYEDEYTIDLIRSSIARNQVIMESPYHNDHLRPTEEDHVYSDDILRFLSGYRSRFRGLRDDQYHEDLTWLEDHIRDRTGVSVAFHSILVRVLRDKIHQKAVWKGFLKRKHIQCIFLVCSYGKEALIEAARESGCVTVEVQHGVISELHSGYSFPGLFRKTVLPDYFLTFGPYWINGLRTAFDEGCILNYGRPPVTKSLERKIVKNPSAIVVISQPEIRSVLLDVLRDADSSFFSSHSVTFKLHPKEYSLTNDDFEDLTARGVSIIRGERPLTELFLESRIIVGVFSTALYEAAALGCHVFLVRHYLNEHLSDLVLNRMCRVIDNLDVLDSLLSGAAGSRPSLIDHNWQENALAIQLKIFSRHNLGHLIDPDRIEGRNTNSGVGHECSS